MSSGGSVTHWVREIQDGDSAAARELWERYFPRLVRLARQKLVEKQLLPDAALKPTYDKIVWM